jgi:hypothetical protein
LVGGWRCHLTKLSCIALLFPLWRYFPHIQPKTMALVAAELSSENAAVPADTAMHNCVVCYDSCTKSISCAMSHHHCYSCLNQFAKQRLADHQPSMLCCSYECGQRFDLDSLNPALDAQTMSALQRMSALQANDDLRECPRCTALVVRSKHRSTVHCQDCALSFCFHHGNA